MIEVISCTGLPEEILTDRGLSFVEIKGAYVYDLLQIKPVCTSTYHPETNGMLECWHKVMIRKFMIRKSGVERNEWDTYRMYQPFVYRSVPHSVTGFTAFELIYGWDVKGPLELFKHS